ncbi:YdcH family protein [Mesobacterium sp. TK19101]|uniref:YdcH family protein n=1 Tax=Mesobacterium hydrothermale TaxID=3111907 RepID=A0ABU6HH79_9RHOB|nr:YdcH family protein [Mesobacterium sp. TK19101]MEC3861814.1 YdcH family protein [Mesobacterium sp. TK19101]
MTTMPARLLTALPAKVARLRRRHHQLAVQIDEELQRPMPCSVALQRLKRQRLRLKDQITYYSKLVGSQDRTRMPVAAHS